jgi:hypothetical protein
MPTMAPMTTPMTMPTTTPTTQTAFKSFRYTEADLQSGVSIMLVESRELVHFDGVVAGISF